MSCVSSRRFANQFGSENENRNPENRKDYEGKCCIAIDARGLGFDSQAGQTRCCQGFAAMFLRVVQALSRGDGSRYWLHSSV